MARWIRWLLLVSLALGPLGVAPAVAQGGEDEFIARLLAQMPPEAKVGQLFLITLPGPVVRPDHPLRSLLETQRIGGVILSPEQGNFSNVGATASELFSITVSLQQQAAGLTPFIPLFIGLRQQGDGPPGSAWTSGAMPLPSPLALGATWNPDRVQAVGRALGEELRAVGINLLLGPPLEVLLEPRPDLGDAGVQTFGGDPHWVSRMARAYLSGLAEGSEGRLLVVPGAFPGEGRAYGREERVAVLTREDLAAFDLVPFITLMRTSTESGRPLLRAVQVSTMRVRGFGGSAQEWTRPLTVDGAALGALLALPEIKAWREGGGVLLSPPLGLPVIRNLYVDERGEVDFRRAALEAFLAGNDLIWLGALHPDPQEAARQAAAIIAFFREKYSTDLAFQNLVNSAVARILRLKYGLYPGFSAPMVLPTSANLPQTVATPAHLQIVRQALEEALVRLHPRETGPVPIPQPGETFLVLVDGRTARACAACPEQRLLPTEVLTRALMTASGEALDATRITVRTFAEALAFLSRAPEAPDLQPEFERATWVLIVALDERPEDPASSLPHLLLSERTDLLAGKQVVFWSLGPLYPLTAREVSRLSRYEALWTHVPPAVEIMARALFGALNPRSRAPLSIAALGYNLADRLRPDPNQVIPLGAGPRGRDRLRNPGPRDRPGWGDVTRLGRADPRPGWIPGSGRHAGCLHRRLFRSGEHRALRRGNPGWVRGGGHPAGSGGDAGDPGGERAGAPLLPVAAPDCEEPAGPHRHGGPADAHRSARADPDADPLAHAHACGPVAPGPGSGAGPGRVVDLRMERAGHPRGQRPVLPAGPTPGSGSRVAGRPARLHRRLVRLLLAALRIHDAAHPGAPQDPPANGRSDGPLDRRACGPHPFGRTLRIHRVRQGQTL